LWRQHRTCRHNKRTTLNALAFEADAEANLLALREQLRAHTYRPGRSVCFVTGGPKPREVFAADFRDRIVHHLLVGWQERVFEPCFIHDSYACRRGKGTLAASDRLMTFLRQATANGRRPAWAQARRGELLSLDRQGHPLRDHRRAHPRPGGPVADAGRALPRPHPELPLPVAPFRRARAGLGPLSRAGDFGSGAKRRRPVAVLVPTIPVGARIAQPRSLC
jgi:hypothetical protein